MSKDIRGGRAFVELLINNQLSKGLSAANRQLNDWGKTSIKAGLGVGAAGLAMTAPFALATQHFVSAGSAIDDMAQRTGLSAATLQKMGYAAKLSGTDVETLEGGLQKWSKKLTEDANNGGKALAKLGLSADQLRSLDTEEQLATLADWMAQIDPQERAAAAMELFGKSGAQLGPMLAQGSEGLRALYQEAQALGLVMSQADVNAAAELGDQFDILTMAAEGLTNKVGAALAPVLIEVSGHLIDASAAGLAWLDNNRAAVIAAAAATAGVVALGGALIVTGAALRTASAAATATVAILTATVSPLGAIGAGLLGAAYAWTSYTTAGQLAGVAIPQALDTIAATAADTWAGINDALKAGDLALAGNVAFAGLKVAWIEGLQALEQLTTPAIADIAATIGEGELGNAASLAWAQITNEAELAALDAAIAWEEFATGFGQLLDGLADKFVDTFDQGSRAAVTGAQHAANTAASILAGLGLDGLAGNLRGAATVAGLGADAGLNATREQRTASRDERDQAAAEALQRRREAIEARRAELETNRQAHPVRARTRSDEALRQARGELETQRQAAATAAQEAADQARRRAQRQTIGDGQALGSFSAAAAAMLGRGGRKAPEEQTAANTEEIVNLAEEQLLATDRLTEKVGELEPLELGP